MLIFFSEKRRSEFKLFKSFILLLIVLNKYKLEINLAKMFTNSHNSNQISISKAVNKAAAAGTDPRY